MAVQTTQYLQEKFSCGNIPTQQDFWDLIDTLYRNFCDEILYIQQVSACSGTAALSGNLVITNDLTATNINATNINATNAYFTFLSAVSSYSVINDIQINELSGFVMQGSDFSQQIPASIIPGAGNFMLSGIGLSSTSWASFGGDLRSDGIIYASCGNSDEWCSAYTTVCTESASWDGDFCDEIVYLNSVSACGGTLTITANAVGIGTGALTPNELLTVGGNISALGGLSATGDNNYFSGNVGIGVVDPSHPLEILNASTGQLRLTHTAGTKYAEFTVNSDGTLHVVPVSQMLVQSLVDSTDFFQVLDAVGTPILNVDATNERVGIGTALPDQALSVVGTIEATCGNSDEWCSTYTTVCTESASWDGDFCDETVYLNSISACAGTVNLSGDLTVTDTIYSDCGNSDEWCSTYTTVCTESASWDADFTEDIDLNCNNINNVAGISACGNLEISATDILFNTDNMELKPDNISKGVIFGWQSSVYGPGIGAFGNTNALSGQLQYNAGRTFGEHIFLIDAVESGRITNDGNFALGTTTADEKLTVSGNISSSGIIYASCGNSNEWCSTYTTVCTESAAWSLDIAPLILNITKTPILSTTSQDPLHFNVDISETPSFSSYALTANTLLDLDNWEYFNGVSFKPFISSGLLSAYQDPNYGCVSFTWLSAVRAVPYYIRYRSWDGFAYSTYQIHKEAI